MRTLIGFVISILLFNACSTSNSSENISGLSENLKGSGEFTIDSSATVLTWIGAKTTGKHIGSVKVNRGSISLIDGKIKNGIFYIDMKTIQVQDNDTKNSQKLISHLKSDDFFDVNRYPTASLKLLSIDSGFVNADLTIKDKTKAINFPAEIKMSETKLNCIAKFEINRTDWGILYGSGSFTDWAKDKIISDIIEFEVKIVANKLP